VTIRDFLNVVLKRARTFQLTLMAFFIVVTVGSFVIPPSYTSTASLLVQSKTQEMSQSDKNNPTISRAIEVTLADVLSEVEILLSEELRYRVIDDLGLASEPLRTRFLPFGEPDEESNKAIWASYLESNLDVEPATNASVIVVSFSDSTGERAARIVNGITSSYLTFRMNLAMQKPLLEQLRRERDVGLRELQAAEENLRSFDAQWKLVAADSQKDELLELLTDTELEIGKLSGDMTAKLTEIASFEEALARYDEGIRRIEPIREDQNIQFLEERLSTLEIELSNLLMYHTEKHSNVQRVQQNIGEIQKKLRSKTEAVLQSIIFTKQQEVDAIESTLNTYRAIQADIEAELASIRANEIESDSLLMEMRRKEDNFTMISKRLDQVRFDFALGKSGQIDVVLTSKGFPPLNRSFPPGFSLILIFAIATAPFVALSTVLVLDHLDHTFREPADIEGHLGIPVLGTIRMADRAVLESLFEEPGPRQESGGGDQRDSP